MSHSSETAVKVSALLLITEALLFLVRNNNFSFANAAPTEREKYFGVPLNECPDSSPLPDPTPGKFPKTAIFPSKKDVLVLTGNYDYGIYGRNLTHNGELQGSYFKLNTDNEKNLQHIFPQIAFQSDDSGLAVWGTVPTSGGHYDMRGRFFGAGFSAQQPEFYLAPERTTTNQMDLTVTVSGVNQFVVAASESTTNGIWWRQVFSNGTLGQMFYAGKPYYTGPMVASCGENWDYALAFQNYPLPDDPYEVGLMRFNREQQIGPTLYFGNTTYFSSLPMLSPNRLTDKPLSLVCIGQNEVVCWTSWLPNYGAYGQVVCQWVKNGSLQGSVQLVSDGVNPSDNLHPVIIQLGQDKFNIFWEVFDYGPPDHKETVLMRHYDGQNFGPITTVIQTDYVNLYPSGVVLPEKNKILIVVGGGATSTRACLQPFSPSPDPSSSTGISSGEASSSSSASSAGFSSTGIDSSSSISSSGVSSTGSSGSTAIASSGTASSAGFSSTVQSTAISSTADSSSALSPSSTGTTTADSSSGNAFVANASLNTTMIAVLAVVGSLAAIILLAMACKRYQENKQKKITDFMSINSESGLDLYRRLDNYKNKSKSSKRPLAKDGNGVVNPYCSINMST